MKMMSVGTGNNVLALPMKMTHPSRKSGGKAGKKLWLRLSNVTATGGMGLGNAGKMCVQLPYQYQHTHMA